MAKRKTVNAYQQIERLTKSQVADLVEMYQHEWWTKGRTRRDAVQMLENNGAIVAFCERGSKSLVAFARVLTDGKYKAVIFDLIVRREARGKGLGRALVEGIIRNAKLAKVRHLELYCRPEMIPFYEQFGFSADLPEVRYMRRVQSR